MNRCFADKEEKCSALDSKVCERHFDWKSMKYKYYDCEFYKTEEQASESDLKSLERLKTLPLETRLGIASAYKISDLV